MLFIKLLLTITYSFLIAIKDTRILICMGDSILSYGFVFDAQEQNPIPYITPGEPPVIMQ